jgi:hypothetical protein
MDNTFNVVEVLKGPKAGRVAVVPSRKPGFRNRLRNARYRVCAVPFEFADGLACGIMMERRVRA